MIIFGRPVVVVFALCHAMCVIVLDLVGVYYSTRFLSAGLEHEI